MYLLSKRWSAPAARLLMMITIPAGAASAQEPLPGALSTPALSALGRETLDENSGGQAARAAVDAAAARERRPDPTLGLRGGHEGLDSLVGLSVSIPLFVRNSFEAEAEAASAELMRAEREAQDLYRRAGARLLSAAERYRLARDAWAIWERTGAPGIESQVALLERIWRAGELSTADYTGAAQPDSGYPCRGLVGTVSTVGRLVRLAWPCNSLTRTPDSEFNALRIKNT